MVNEISSNNDKDIELKTKLETYALKQDLLIHIIHKYLEF